MAEGGSDIVSRAKLIAESIYHACINPDKGVRVKETGSISPARSLKNLKARKAFRWAGDVAVKHKYFTRAACRLAIRYLLEMPNVEVPSLPQMPMDHWIEQQAKLIQHLCQRSRKNSVSSMRFEAYRQRRTMDWETTVPMFEASYRLSVFAILVGRSGIEQTWT